MQQIIHAAFAVDIIHKERVYWAEDQTPNLLHRKQTLYHSAIENCGTYIDQAMVFQANSIQSSTEETFI